MAVASASILATLLALEVPALLDRVDYRFVIGHADRSMRPEPKPYPKNTTVHESTQPDMSEAYGLAGRRLPIVFRTDRYGFRNSVDLDHAPLVVIGDSFVVNPVIDEAHLFTTLLSTDLRVPVANFGHSGWGPYNELAVLRRTALSLRPAVVVWVFYEGNDLADTLVYGGNDIPQWYRSFTSNARLQFAALLEQVLHGRTRINFGWAAGDPPYGSCQTRCAAPPCPRTYFGNLAGPLTKYEEVAVQRLFAILSQAAAEIRAQGASFVVAYAPVKLRAYRDSCDFDEDNPARASSFNDLPQRMQAWAVTNGSSFVDLSQPLANAAARGEMVYFADDTHWNEGGNAVVAAALAADPTIRKALNKTE